MNVINYIGRDINKLIKEKEKSIEELKLKKLKYLFNDKTFSINYFNKNSFPILLGIDYLQRTKNEKYNDYTLAYENIEGIIFNLIYNEKISPNFLSILNDEAYKLICEYFEKLYKGTISPILENLTISIKNNIPLLEITFDTDFDKFGYQYQKNFILTHYFRYIIYNTNFINNIISYKNIISKIIINKSFTNYFC